MDVTAVTTNEQGKICLTSSGVVHGGCDGRYTDKQRKVCLESHGIVHKDEIVVTTITKHC